MSSGVHTPEFKPWSPTYHVISNTPHQTGKPRGSCSVISATELEPRALQGTQPRLRPAYPGNRISGLNLGRWVGVSQAKNEEDF